MRLRNVNTGVIVNVAADKVGRFGSDWVPADPPAPTIVGDGPQPVTFATGGVIERPPAATSERRQPTVNAKPAKK